jgi:thiamine biosynthesis lipoprotein
MIRQVEFHAMGCHMLGVLDAGDAAIPALEALPAQLEAWEQSLSRFRSDSELCQLNCQPGIPVTVSQVLWDVFVAARQAEAETHGLVNPLVADALVHVGYDRSFELLQPVTSLSGSVDLLSPVPGLADVAADASTRTLRLPAGVHLDFGGVAKGWAAQQAVLALAPYGPALFSAGGDMAISGPRLGDEPWVVGVDDPFRPGEYIEHLYLEQGGIATSGKDYRRWMRAGLLQHHIIDPRNGLPAETDILTATVIAPDAMLAEAFAKAILISGSEAGLAWLDGDERLAGLLILDNGERVYSHNMGAFL